MKTRPHKPHPSDSAKGARNRSKGYQVEGIVKTYLIEQGLKAVCNNYRCKSGEIDLVLTDKNTLVFAEIRFRKNTLYGSSIETVSLTKQKKLILAAEHFLQHHSWSKQLNCRFDVIGATAATQSDKHCYNGLKIDWIKNAFQT